VWVVGGGGEVGLGGVDKTRIDGRSRSRTADRPGLKQSSFEKFVG
jgi:hypothetical protein